MVSAADMATQLNATSAANLKKAGLTHVGRYINPGWKQLTATEVAAIKAAGLKIFSIFERSGVSPIKSSYFTTAQGHTDALDAYHLGMGIGQPEMESAIYFTVDYDAPDADLPAILAYFKEIKSVLKSYKIGAYGKFSVLNYLYAHNAVDYYFQTVAWSGNQRCNFKHIYQYQVDKTLAGINVDYDELEKSDVGAWGQPAPAQNGILTTGVPYRVIIPNLQFWQAKTLVTQYQQRGYKCDGIAVNVYGPGQQPKDNDPYKFVLYVAHDEAVKLVIELKNKGYALTYGEEIK